MQHSKRIDKNKTHLNLLQTNAIPQREYSCHSLGKKQKPTQETFAVTKLSNFIILTSISLTGCASMTAPMEYAKSEPLGNSAGGATPGYADVEISPGVYVVEVRKIGGYQFIFNANETKELFSLYWKRRAMALCPAGYSGEPVWILPMNAKIYQFRCSLRFCQNYPMISGTAQCKIP